MMGGASEPSEGTAAGQAEWKGPFPATDPSHALCPRAQLQYNIIIIGSGIIEVVDGCEDAYR